MKRLAALLTLVPCLLTAQEGAKKGEEAADPPKTAKAAAKEEPASRELVGTLAIANDNKLHGIPEGIGEDGDLVWNSKSLREAVPIKLSKILEMRLEGGTDPKIEVGHHAILTLTNGDNIRGQLDALDDEHVTLKTWYGGKLKIRRSMAKDLEIVRSERAVYTGPEDLQAWTIDGERDAWSLQSGVLAARKGAGIARQVPMPDKCRIGFDVNWRTSLRFRVLFFSDEGDTSTPENCYDLVCQQRFVYLRKRWNDKRTGGTRIVGQFNLTELTEKEKVRMDFYIDRKTGTIALYVDGKRANVWSDQDPSVGKFGNWLHFISEDFYPVEVSRIRVSPWKGELPENVEIDADEEALEGEEGQIIRLQNGDIVVGDVGKIVDGVLDIKTKHCDMKIPVGRMRSVNLSIGEYEEPKRMKGDVRAWLREGGRLTFRLDSFEGEKLMGLSQTFGEAEFSLNAFSRLEFNIYNEDYDSMRSGTKW